MALASRQGDGAGRARPDREVPDLFVGRPHGGDRGRLADRGRARKAAAMVAAVRKSLEGGGF